MMKLYEAIGRTHALVRNVYNINNNRKPNPHKWVALSSYDSIQKAIKAKLKIDYFLYCQELASATEIPQLLEQLDQSKGYLISQKTYETIIDKEETKFGIMVIAEFPIKTLDQLSIADNMRVVILDGLEVQGNVGTIIRSCDGAGIDAVILTNKRIRITHPKFMRASMGTSLFVPIVQAEVDETMYWLQKYGFTLYLTDTSANANYNEVDYEGNIAILAGSEKFGVTKDFYQYSNVSLIKIPMRGEADSLNVGVATSIVIYQSMVGHEARFKR
jgi:TrmH family RNA methyltransferase